LKKDLENRNILLIFVLSIKTYIMKTLTVSIETFNEMLLGLIKSGVTFEAEEREGKIIIDFTGGY
jgi:hypothetical protein